MHGMRPTKHIAKPGQTIGGVEQAKQSHRDERSILWLEQTGQDLRHACGTRIRNPGFAFAAVITLALGIGVNTTLFTAYDWYHKPNHVSEWSWQFITRRELRLREPCVAMAKCISETRHLPPRRFCLERNPSRDHAQFTVTITAVVALMAPLEPVTVTV